MCESLELCGPHISVSPAMLRSSNAKRLVKSSESAWVKVAAPLDNPFLDLEGPAATVGGGCGGGRSGDVSPASSVASAGSGASTSTHGTAAREATAASDEHDARPSPYWRNLKTNEFSAAAPVEGWSDEREV